MFGRCRSFNTSENSGAAPACAPPLHYTQTGDGDERQRRDTAGVPLSLEISLSELSDVQCTHTLETQRARVLYVCTERGSSHLCSGI